MTSMLYLEDSLTRPLRPQEGVPGDRSLISPFAIPSSIVVDDTLPNAMILSFVYAGGQVADLADHLDDATDPMVEVWTASRTNTVMALVVSPRVGAEGIKRVADRMLERANYLNRVDKKFSYQMVGRVLMACADKIVRPTAETTPESG